MKIQILFTALSICLLTACTKQMAVLQSSSNLDVYTTRGKPVWETRQTTFSKAAPWLAGAAAAGAGYYYFESGFDYDGDHVSRGGAAALCGSGSLLLTAAINGGIKAAISRQQFKPVVSGDLQDWLRKLNRENNWNYELKSSIINRDQTIDLMLGGKPLPPPPPQSPVIAKQSKLEPPPSQPTRPNVKWSPRVLFDNEVFPSFILGMANFTGSKDFLEQGADFSSALGFEVQNRTQGAMIKYEIVPVETEYFEPVKGEIALKYGDNVFFPNVPWKFTPLLSLKQSKPLKVYFRLSDFQGNKIGEELVTIRLRSVNDCILRYNDTDLTWLFAAYVNEEHPEIDKILREAIDYGWIQEWTGYQQNDSEEVVHQVYAVWRVLLRRGFAYSNITDTPGSASKNLHSQAVRLFSDAIANRQANCVDGTVVFASILKKIGLNPKIILYPGHAFLGFDVPLNDGKAGTMYLETTMLANERKEEKILENFLNALKVGEIQYMENNDKITVIDIHNQREMVKPIGN